ncbi:hypothetical protein E2493_04305 [Sphingomonas parva]|uniref:Putative auto-transporter adhesin head GIN domain-containing protein n=1 Tax=Sphingomonas parva TaxID=2555898 RepID=A0A4Y8ZTS0_9SPHN|nr:DUF2807 domain-containing protein [Sphingomonas parva]TFI59423.1 hypothetical protein E2493_04305 [Sphingomonas parva]
MRIRPAAALLFLSVAVPASAETVVPVARFDAVALTGGGEVRIRHGAAQKVTLLRGNLETSRFTVRNGGLEIRACTRTCRDYDLVVEIVTPDVHALAITGGGSIVAEGAFPARKALAASITGGGVIDADAMRTQAVAASIKGGGVIRTNPQQSLAAAIKGGGNVVYRGDPHKTVVVDGGGEVTRAD